MNATDDSGAANAERIRHLYAEYARGNRDAVFGALAEDVVWRSLPEGLP